MKSDIFRRFFICKNILKKLSCYHDNYFRYFMFGKYNGFVSKARVSACMYFSSNIGTVQHPFLRVRKGAEGALINIHTNEGAEGALIKIHTNQGA